MGSVRMVTEKEPWEFDIEGVLFCFLSENKFQLHFEFFVCVHVGEGERERETGREEERGKERERM